LFNNRPNDLTQLTVEKSTIYIDDAFSALLQVPQGLLFFLLRWGFEPPRCLRDMRPTSVARWVSETKTPQCGVFVSGVAQSTSFEARLCLARKTTCDGDWRENFNYLFHFCLIYDATGAGKQIPPPQPKRKATHKGWLP